MLCYYSESNQFEFSYLTKLLSTFKVRPNLNAFHSQLSDELLNQCLIFLQANQVVGKGFR